MNRNITLLLILLLSFSSISFSQTPLPYHMGFDSIFPQGNWQAYRKGILTSYDWSTSSFGPYAGAGYLYHDYPLGSAGTDTTLDWYVSPAFNFAGGGKIDSVKIGVYTIANLTAVDHLGLYLLSGAQDPSAATNIRLLADLSYMASNTRGWRDTGGIVIPATSGMSHIGIKYRATQNWFTVGVDEMYLSSANGLGLPPICGGGLGVSVYPNPSHGMVTVQNTIAPNLEMYIYDQLGREVKREEINSGTDLSLNLPDGLYIYKMVDADRTVRSVGRLLVAR